MICGASGRGHLAATNRAVMATVVSAPRGMRRKNRKVGSNQNMSAMPTTLYDSDPRECDGAILLLEVR
jgi:hypothetical protein